MSALPVDIHQVSITPYRDAYEAGYAAANIKKGVEFNPYHNKRMQRRAWLDGYADALRGNPSRFAERRRGMNRGAMLGLAVTGFALTVFTA